MILAEIGRYMTTTEEASAMFMKYMMLPSQPTQELASLQDQIYNANEQTMQMQRVQKPQIPY